MSSLSGLVGQVHLARVEVTRPSSLKALGKNSFIQFIFIYVFFYKALYGIEPGYLRHCLPPQCIYQESGSEPSL